MMRLISVKCSYKNTISYHSAALLTLSFLLYGFVHVFYFIRKLAQALLVEVSYIFYCFLLVMKTNEQKNLL